MSRGFGNITYTASITMDYATQQLLRSVYGSLLEIGEFDLIISFANPMAGEDWTTTTVTLKGCIFRTNGSRLPACFGGWGRSIWIRVRP